jgi:hypothetical protein
MQKVIDDQSKQGADIDASGTAIQKSISRAETAFNSAKSIFEGYQNTQIARCMQQTASAKFSIETDADGRFKIRLPKAEHFIVFAATSRMVGIQEEIDSWIVPFSLNGQPSGTLILSNDNILLSPDGSGAKIIDLRSRHDGVHWRKPDGNGGLLPRDDGI